MAIVYSEGKNARSRGLSMTRCEDMDSRPLCRPAQSRNGSIKADQGAYKLTLTIGNSVANLPAVYTEGWGLYGGVWI